MLIAKLEGWGEEFIAADYQTKSLFNGMSWHSQTLGPLVAMLNAFIMTDYLCSFKRKNWLYRILLVAAPLLIIKTSSRTAVFAYIISVLASAFFFMQEHRAPQRKKQMLLTSLVIAMMFGFVLVVISPDLQQRMEAFLRKAEDVSELNTSESLGESLTKSRMGLVERGMQNFKERPLTGNGFQVSEEMKLMDKSDNSMLVSAPIEKGVLPVMVLEEGGLVGAIIILAFLINIYTRYSKLHLNGFLATFTVFIALNTGEASFFSTSGTGGILWAICFSALVLDVDRHRRLLAEKQMRSAGAGFGPALGR